MAQLFLCLRILPSRKLVPKKPHVSVRFDDPQFYLDPYYADMSSNMSSRRYMMSVIIVGAISLTAAIVRLPIERFDIHALLLFIFTIGLGSQISIKIPRFNSHIAVSDTFIFLTLLLYGGEFAIILSAVEAFVSSWRFCNKKVTVFFNAAAVSISTSMVFVILNVAGLYSENQLHGRPQHTSDFLIVLSVLALSQFAFNTSLATIIRCS